MERAKTALKVGVLLFLLATGAFAQTKVVPVYVEHSGEDAVGQMVVFELREALRGSKGMKLVTETKDPHINVGIASLDVGNKGVSTAMAISLAYTSADTPLAGLRYWTGVRLCGRDVARTCAQGILAAIDAQINRLRIESPLYWNRL